MSDDWSSASVVSGSTSGGVIGYANVGVDGELVWNNIYWDEGASGQTSAIGDLVGGPGNVGGNGATGIGGTTGLSPTQASSYPGFDFTNTWTINPGVSPPTLRAIGP
jgi:hypothetical protein